MVRRLRVGMLASARTRWSDDVARQYRGLVHALAGRGHQVTEHFLAWKREPAPHGSAQDDVLIHVVHGTARPLTDDLLRAKSCGVVTVLWDVEAPATLERLDAHEAHPLSEGLGLYDLVLTGASDAERVEAYRRLGAVRCLTFLGAIDPRLEHPVAAEPGFEADLAFEGDRPTEVEGSVEELFLRPATRLRQLRFLLGGTGWEGHALPANVRWLGPVPESDRNAFASTPAALLDLEPRRRGVDPNLPTLRLLRAAAAGACVIVQEREGLQSFFEPGREILVARNGDEVSDLLAWADPEGTREIGRRACERVLAEHTWDRRARELERALGVERDTAARFAVQATTAWNEEDSASLTS